MKKTILSVYSNPETGVLCSNLEAYSGPSGRRRFIGWEHVPMEGKGPNDKGGTYNPLSEAVTLTVTDNTHYSEYIRQLKAGELLPADEATAKASGTRLKTSKDVKKETKTS